MSLFNRRILKSLVAAFIAMIGLIIIYSVAIKYSQNVKVLKNELFLQNQTDGLEERKRIIGLLRHAWDGYEKYAFGADMLLPISKSKEEWFGLGLSILDTLDTALIMGQEDIYQKCRTWIKNEFKIDAEKYTISIFETNIRIVGGFLSTYSLTKDKLFLEKAKQTADKLLEYFHPVSGIPSMYMESLQRRGSTTLADAGSLSLTFKYLSYVTGDPKYWNAVTKISKKFYPSLLNQGVLGSQVDVESGNIYGTPTIGPGADSYYEYLAKQYIQTNRVEEGFPPQWEVLMKSIRSSLKTSAKGHFMFVDGGYGLTCHLDCFLAGTIGLYAIQGARNSNSLKLTSGQLQDIDLAEELTRGCYELYHQTKTHLSPEIVYWNYDVEDSEPLTAHKTPQKSTAKSTYSLYKGTVSRLSPFDSFTSGDFKIKDSRYIHRPETMESLFYMYRITGKQMYRDMGWEIFLAYEKYLKTDDAGYAGLDDVDDTNSSKIDKMESFLFGEFIKYLYLLFCDESVIPLDKYVFNTEAHPLPIFNVTAEFRKMVDWL